MVVKQNRSGQKESDTSRKDTAENEKSCFPYKPHTTEKLFKNKTTKNNPPHPIVMSPILTIG